MRCLVLVKHAQPAISADLPRRQWHLSEAGIAACGPLAEHLARYAPARLVASPEPKAQETAHALMAAVGAARVETVSGLREQDDGDSPLDGEAEFRAKVSAFFAQPSTLVFGAETADDAYARFSGAIDEATELDMQRSLVAVTHGRVISLFVARRNDLDAYGLWVRLGLPSIVVLRLPDHRIEEVVERL